ncbi:RNA polymerase sigma factor SigZ [Microbulbifer sp. GL-2]|uniref:RNA polymerase sigma factor SigZ n=1 Tax=Microbulbifer sp. GL-2 TaxID=2591606 RepID=UPI00117F91E8|nr:RNA polymerase sigma factor SigZ [Microbulbifer sp. GL-2]
MTIDSIWKEYRSALKAFLHSKISSPDEVDDILQEVLIKTHKNIHTVRDQDSIKSWLFQIANRTVIDFYRKNSKIKEVALEDTWLSEEGTDAQRGLSACIEPFIRALPSQTAELLTAIELNGQSQKAYAEEHGTPYSTIKSQVQKGREQLRRLYEDCCQLTLDHRGTVIDYIPKSKNHRNC